MIWFRKRSQEPQRPDPELVARRLDAEQKLAEVKDRWPAIEKRAARLHELLEENGFAERLYRAMVEGQR
jgi:DNA-binding SARP family transcriptional activator